MHVHAFTGGTPLGVHEKKNCTQILINIKSCITGKLVFNFHLSENMLEVII